MAAYIGEHDDSAFAVRARSAVAGIEYQPVATHGETVEQAGGVLSRERTVPIAFGDGK
jgi:hypothetical protein